MGTLPNHFPSANRSVLHYNNDAYRGGVHDIVAWNGIPLPPGVTNIEIYTSSSESVQRVAWRKNGKVHAMDVPEGPDFYDVISAIAVAMRMSE